LIDYKKSGVDIQAGDQLVSWLQTQQPEISSTQKSDSNFHFKKLRVPSDVPDLQKRVFSGIGGFAALFDGRFEKMAKPLLISCTDGVGTKVKLASYFNDYSTIGQDLVAMCVNDLICTGGTPLFFLDYYATGKLQLEAAQAFLKGIKKACDDSHLILIGGETAEMPGVYQSNDFDCAGFSVGVVDESQLWGAHRVQENDRVIGLTSSGYHSNGFSLIRKVFENDFDQNKKWLLEPTRLYVEATLKFKNAPFIHAVAHITGGGIDNLPRVLPEHLKAQIMKWEFPDCFKEVQKRSGLSDLEMRETFNCGIGLMMVVSQDSATTVMSELKKLDYECIQLGQILKRNTQDAHVEWA
jgi:phosphoribosylformylglycinamidine cyclo-ligase